MPTPPVPFYPMTHDDAVEMNSYIGSIASEQLTTMNSILSSIAANNGGLKVTGWSNLHQLVRLNLHRSIPVRDQFIAERETALVASIGDSTGITAVTVDEDVFLAAVGEAHEGVYEATFDGAAWHKEDGAPILLADYGITVTGTPANGDHVIVTETARSLTFDVLDHDKMVDDGKYSIVLGMHDIMTYGTIPFDAPELLFYTAEGISANKYRFTLDHGAYGGGTGQDGTYIFELAQAIPAGGGFRHSAVGAYRGSGDYAKSQITGGTITTYGAAPGRAVVQSGIAVREWDGEEACVDLGKFTAEDAQYATDTTAHNFTERNAYGSNRYATSAVRQWLNSTGKAVTSGDTAVSHWWSAQTVFDMPPAGAALAGFLHGLDPSLVAELGTANVVVSMPNPDRTAGQPNSETLHDKVFLFSMKEIGFGDNIGVAEGSLLAYYQGATNADRIKRENATARNWFLRGPYPGSACNVRLVYSGGSLSNNYAFNAFGFVPGLIISSD